MTRKEGSYIVPHLAKKIENAFFEISGDNVKLQKIMSDRKHPSNLNMPKPPKTNPEIESSQQFQGNISFVMTNEKGLYSSQMYVIKAISILSNVADNVLKSSDDSTCFGKISQKKEKYCSRWFSCPLWTKTRDHISKNKTKKNQISLTPR